MVNLDMKNSLPYLKKYIERTSKSSLSSPSTFVDLSPPHLKAMLFVEGPVGPEPCGVFPELTDRLHHGCWRSGDLHQGRVACVVR